MCIYVAGGSSQLDVCGRTTPPADEAEFFRIANSTVHPVDQPPLMASPLSVRAVKAACIVSNVAPRPLSTLISRRPFSTSPKSGSTAEQSSEQDIAIEEAKRPRWSYTPPAAKAPFSLRARKHPEYRVNEDPAVLDQFYVRLLGDGGEKVLQDELKWLAVTHKSFDQGRRGFNDRLAFLGKNIVQLQASLALVQNGEAVSQIDKYGRTPFTHPATQGLRNLSSDTKSFLTDRTKLADLAMQRYNMEKVIRWNPRDPTNLEGSGLELVLAHSLYAVVGAVAMEKGGQYANEVAKERILAPLGVKVA
ncbi:hypothetical protein N7468_007974 [Penicillium chermesinum]|uniref:RNase III domain-containing protein n=1 Tax=Penicillium chermesinum TaxID=63820 RepID=A0A9W9NNV2_9EURO|nr:uncharacterized protein N7468_007974 [Penicillium chermesinum]KAJ5223432.1 hypothetical protein N7468_007974 [Penicillium chermesinum]